MTPEGRVKAKIKKLLKEFETFDLWCDWPVPAGYGKSTLDCIGVIGGSFFAIEAKAEGKKPTALQQQMLNAISNAGGNTFIIVGVNSDEFNRLRWFLETCTKA
jgi:hypothetical protein